MMTIVTSVFLKEGAEPEWDAAMQERLSAAKTQAGWIGGQLVMPSDAMRTRVIVGTWETHAAWEAWHQDAAFAETRQRLDGLEAKPSQHVWHEVVVDVRP
jgi:heme-degrading monooxygenase HmoA